MYRGELVQVEDDILFTYNINWLTANPSRYFIKEVALL